METLCRCITMVKICSHTIAKNSESFVKPVLEQILPYVDRAIISVDLTSTDKTVEIVTELTRKYKKIDFWRQGNPGEYPPNAIPIERLTKERNEQIKSSKEDYIWIVDDDEYYTDDQIKDILEKVEKTKAESYSVKFWFLTDKYNYNPARGKRTLRIFKNNGINWQGKFGNEFLPVKNTEHLNNYYFHLSYLKSRSWRNDFNIKKYTKQAPIAELPKNICQKLERFWEENYLKQ